MTVVVRRSYRRASGLVSAHTEELVEGERRVRGLVELNWA